MEIDFRIPAVTAGAAFVVVVLTGAVAGVGFGALLLRAILGALAFAALGVGGEMTVKKFLPELFGTSVEKNVDDRNGSADGGTVSITLDEENPHRSADVQGAQGDESGTLEADGTVAGAGEVAESGVASINETDAQDVEELETIDEERAESDTPEQVGQQTASGETSETPRSDNLPTFDAVESTFDSTVDPASAVPAAASAGVDVMGQEEDPETVAKAVRTLLKRDEEG